MIMSAAVVGNIQYSTTSVRQVVAQSAVETGVSMS